MGEVVVSPELRSTNMTTEPENINIKVHAGIIINRMVERQKMGSKESAERTTSKKACKKITYH